MSEDQKDDKFRYIVYDARGSQVGEFELLIGILNLARKLFNGSSVKQLKIEDTVQDQIYLLRSFNEQSIIFSFMDDSDA